MIDVRCTVVSNFGRVVDGSIRQVPAQSEWLVYTEGTLTIAGVSVPGVGKRLKLAYERDGLLTRFPRKLYVIAATANPYKGQTFVRVGDRLALAKSLQGDLAIIGADESPPDWWVALDPADQESVPPPIKSSAVLARCLSELGIPDAGGEPLTGTITAEEVSLDSGYANVMSRLMRSEGRLGVMQKDGSFQVRKWPTQSVGGPVFDREQFIEFRPVEGVRRPWRSVKVRWEAPEVTNGGLLFGSPDGFDPDATDSLGGLPDGYDFDPLNFDPLDPNLDGLNLDLLEDSFLGDFDPSDNSDQEEQFRRNWEFSDETGNPQEIRVAYQSPEGGEMEAVYMLMPYSSTRTKYQKVRDAEGRAQWVVGSREGKRSGIVAQANPNLTSTGLELGLDSGAMPANARTFTEYQYEVAEDGVKVIYERTTEYITEVELAGKLGIDDYTAGTEDVIGLGTGELIGQVRTSYYSYSGNMTQVSVAEYRAWGLTQEGTQQSAKAAKDATSLGRLAQVINAAKAMVLVNQTVRSAIGRGPVQTRPPRIELQSSETLGQPTTDGGKLENRLSIRNVTDEVRAAIDPAGGAGDDLDFSTLPGDTAEAVLELPFPSGAYVAAQKYSDGTLKLYAVPGGAQARALEYAKTELYASWGQANGVTIALAPWEFPADPFSPLILRAAGIATEFRVNAPVWTITPGGMIVSCDALLIGALGTYDAPNALPWVPMSSSIQSLPAAPAVTDNGSPVPADSITTPVDFDPATPETALNTLPEDGADVPRQESGGGPLVPPVALLGFVRATTRTAARVTGWSFDRSSRNYTITATSGTGGACRFSVAISTKTFGLTRAMIHAPSLSGAIASVPTLIHATTIGRAQVGPELWTPASIATAFWLDAADASTMTLDGSSVTEWRDKSGNDMHAAKDPSWPAPLLDVEAWNNLNGVRFGSASNTRLIVPSSTEYFRFLHESEAHVFAVFISDHYSDDGMLLETASWGAGPGMQIEVQGRYGDHYVQTALYGATSSGSYHYEQTNEVLMIQHDAEIFNVAINAQEASASDWVRSFVNGAPSSHVEAGVTQPGDYTGPCNKDLMIGDGYYGDFRGVLLEKFMVGGPMTEAMQQKAIGYLAHKWGRLTRLAVDHPYKTFPPFEE